MKKKTIPIWLFPLLVGVVTFLWALRPIWNIDIWWHIALGRHILFHGLPETDVLSAALSSDPWTTFQGGYEIFVALLHDAGGLFLVRAVHAGAIGCGMGLLFHLSRKASGSGWLGLVVVMLAMVLYEDRVRVRPHVFHFLFILVMVARVVRDRGPWRWAEAKWLVPMMCVWASFHGPGSLWGLALMGTICVMHFKNKTTWQFLAVTFGTMVLTPGVFEGWVSAFNVHVDPGLQARFVPEHSSLFAYIDPEMGIGPHGKQVFWVVISILVATVAGVWFVLSRQGEKGFPWSLLLAALGMGIFSVAMARFAWYALIPLLLLISVVRVPRPLVVLGLLVSTQLLLWDTLGYVNPQYASDSTVLQRWERDVHLGRFPDGAGNYLEKSAFTARVYNEVGWGGYLLYRGHPQIKTLFDGRIAFGAASRLLELDSQKRKELRGQEWYEWRVKLADTAHKQYGIDMLVVRPNFFGNIHVMDREGYLEQNPWYPIYCEKDAEIWSRKNIRFPVRKARAQCLQRDRVQKLLKMK